MLTSLNEIVGDGDIEGIAEVDGVGVGIIEDEGEKEGIDDVFIDGVGVVGPELTSVQY